MIPEGFLRSASALPALPAPGSQAHAMLLAARECAPSGLAGLEAIRVTRCPKGTAYTTLDRLTANGFLRKEGRQRTARYRITALGMVALRVLDLYVSEGERR